MEVRRTIRLLPLLLGACAAEPASPRLDAGVAPPEARCRPPAGVSAAPSTIAGVVALANALPHPLTLTCFLESLDRPLALQAAISRISFQPSMGERSPRIFLLLDPLVLSVAPAGSGQALIELGERVGPARSLKGELAFPVEAALSDEAPLEHVRDGGGTTCRFCHPDEAPAPELGPQAYVSGAFRPPSRARVSLASLLDESARCDNAAEPARCAILRALFAHGEVREADFPASVPLPFADP
jgi:hypothetical protein